MTSLPVAPGDRSAPWLDVFPPTWHVKPAKYACSINGRTVPETTDPDTEFRYVDISSVDSEGNWSASEPLRFGDAPSRARRIVADGDVLVSTVRTYLRAIAHVDKVDEPLICSTGFAVLSANGAAFSKFLAYWARSVYFVDEVVARSVGVSYPAVNASDVGNIPCPLLPLDEQRAIARFLDRETARIDALIEKKRRQIELLQEKRAALISHAVTKGLDPNAPMKGSGIEWLGEVPAHWQIPPLYARFSVELGKMLDEKRITGEHLLPYVRNVDAQWDAVNVTGLPEMDITPDEYPRYTLKEGDLLVCEGGEVGRTATWRGELPVCAFQKAIHRIRPLSGRDLPRFFYYVMRATAFTGVFVAQGNPNTIPHLTAEKLRVYRFAFPPAAEQRAIVDFLDSETAKIDALVGKINLSINRLREYRTALISAAVTGKIDVRKEVD